LEEEIVQRGSLEPRPVARTNLRAGFFVQITASQSIGGRISKDIITVLANPSREQDAIEQIDLSLSKASIRRDQLIG
jgi:hypothetical protein